MQVSGQHNFSVSVHQLWKYLMDPKVLAKVTPGVTQLKTLSLDEYQSVSDIKIGPVKGAFKGKLQVTDKQKPHSFTIHMEQLSKIGNAHVKVNMLLNEIEAEKSRLTFDGKAKLSGVIARTGQRVLSGVANTITKEVFASLEQHIEEQNKIQKNANNIPSPRTQTETIRTEKAQTETAQNEVESVTSNSINEVDKPIQSTNKTPNETPNKTPQPINFFTRVLNFIKNLLGIK